MKLGPVLDTNHPDHIGAECFATRVARRGARSTRDEHEGRAARTGSRTALIVAAASGQMHTTTQGGTPWQE